MTTEIAVNESSMEAKQAKTATDQLILALSAREIVNNPPLNATMKGLITLFKDRPDFYLFKVCAFGLPNQQSTREEDTLSGVFVDSSRTLTVPLEFAEMWSALYPEAKPNSKAADEAWLEENLKAFLTACDRLVHKGVAEIDQEEAVIQLKEQHGNLAGFFKKAMKHASNHEFWDTK